VVRDVTDEASFTCPRCGAESHHPMDAAEGYCGACHDWTGERTWAAFIEWHMYYDRDGRPIPLRQWCELVEAGRRSDGRDYKRVAEDYLIVDGEPLRVSTVWLGIDMSFDYRPGHVPIIFETMTFGHGRGADVQERWPTEAAALAGHERLVAELLHTGAHHD
jgi:hypothetical protein